MDSDDNAENCVILNPTDNDRCYKTNRFYKMLDKALANCPKQENKPRPQKKKGKSWRQRKMETTKMIIDMFDEQGGKFFLWSEEANDLQRILAEEVKQHEYLKDIIHKSGVRRSQQKTRMRPIANDMATDPDVVSEPKDLCRTRRCATQCPH